MIKYAVIISLLTTVGYSHTEHVDITVVNSVGEKVAFKKNSGFCVKNFESTCASTIANKGTCTLHWVAKKNDPSGLACKPSSINFSVAVSNNTTLYTAFDLSYQKHKMKLKRVVKYNDSKLKPTYTTTSEGDSHLTGELTFVNKGK